MKVGIITIHNSPNYGACLQSFALYQYLKLQDYNVEMIDLHRPYHADYKQSHKYVTYAESMLPLAQRLKRKIKRLINKSKQQQIPPQKVFNPAIKKIESFNSQIKLSKPFYGVDELYSNPPQYDIYITGSDQVWNPSQKYCIEPYFLTFVKQGKRISYASSIGQEFLPNKVAKDYKRWLKYYDAISVREQKAQKLLCALTKRDIEKVSDPTFLLDVDFWQNLSIKPETDNYIMLFTLEKDNNQLSYAKKIAKESGKRLIVISQWNNNQDTDSDCIWINDAGPKEWLGYIAHANMVITDSFHCSVFSIILGANNFYAYIAPWNNRGNRIRELLNDFSLNQHLLKSDLSQSYTELIQNKINRKLVLDVYWRIQQHGRNFLTKNGGK